MFTLFKKLFSNASKAGSVDETVTKHHLLAEVGRAMILCQLVEKQIEFTVYHILRDPTMTWADLEKKLNGKNTLGPLIKDLRKRINLPPDFDALLNSFRLNRNELIHCLVRQPEFDIHTNEGRHETVAILKPVIEEASDILNILKPYILQYREDLLNHFSQRTHRI